jgi:hypothetical protein
MEGRRVIVTLCHMCASYMLAQVRQELEAMGLSRGQFEVRKGGPNVLKVEVVEGANRTVVLDCLRACLHGPGTTPQEICAVLRRHFG